MLVFGFVLAAAAGATSLAHADGTDGYLAELVEQARAAGLARSREWQVLLHYRPRTLGGSRSEADGLDFFLAGKRGVTDPSAELEATLAAFVQRASEAQGAEHAQCRFPARWAWLKRSLRIDPVRFPDRPCPRFESWRTGLSASAVTLVFAAAYLNSPASMYGHTFLRLSRTTGEHNPLLDYVINFAADATTENGLLYVVNGVAGGFPGLFYVMPYYIKVQEYSHMESRDLWEYPLALTQEQVDRLVMHAWEMKSTHFDYYFFTENCSYHLLALLEAADPSLHLLDGFGPRVIPADTVRVVLDRARLAGSPTPRPSHVRLMTRRRSLLEGREASAAVKLARAADRDTAATLLAPFAKERQALVLDSAYDYLRYSEGFKKVAAPDFAKRERELLLTRGRLGIPSQPVVATPGSDAPETGHRTLKVGVGAGVDARGGTFEEISVRGAIHDFLDDPRGYSREAVLEMGHLELRVDNRAGRVDLERLNLMHLVAATPFDRWMPKNAWKLWLGADNARELGCDGWRCLYFGANFGAGVAAELGSRSLFFVMADLDLATGPAFGSAHYHRLGGGGSAGLVARPTSFWRVKLEASYVDYVSGDRRRNLRASVEESFSLSRRLELRVGARAAGPHAEASAALHGYF